MSSKSAHVIMVMGASGDLSKKSIFPALWNLFKGGHLPDNTFIIGFARSRLQVDDIRARSQDFLNVDKSKEDQAKFKDFWKINRYTPGSYTDAKDSIGLTELLEKIEEEFDSVDRTFYLALPPSVYESVTELIKTCWMAPSGRTKVAIEKPFGHDLKSSIALDNHLSSLFEEQQLCRIDHYLCLEMVQSILALRFCNKIFSSTWNNEHIKSVLITFKEDFGTEGRGGYFDKSGIIRDVMQNHLLQVLCLVAMEKPVTSSDNHMRQEKIKLLECIRPIDPKEVVLGQYTAKAGISEGPESFGYLDDKTVPKGSNTATFATIVFHIDNERWSGVPFIMRCGKATNELKDEVRIQYQPVSHEVLSTLFPQEESTPNELVIQLKPIEKLALRVMSKKPGLGTRLETIEMDLTYDGSSNDRDPTGPYERLLLSIIKDSAAAHFVGREELFKSWSLFTPLLQEIEGKNKKPDEYEFGSTGPVKADELCQKFGVIFSEKYPW